MAATGTHFSPKAHRMSDQMNFKTPLESGGAVTEWKGYGRGSPGINLNLATIRIEENTPSET